jgi:hypothetical protein
VIHGDTVARKEIRSAKRTRNARIIRGTGFPRTRPTFCLADGAGETKGWITGRTARRTANKTGFTQGRRHFRTDRTGGRPIQLLDPTERKMTEAFVIEEKSLLSRRQVDVQRRMDRRSMTTTRRTRGPWRRASDEEREIGRRFHICADAVRAVSVEKPKRCGTATKVITREINAVMSGVVLR